MIGSKRKDKPKPNEPTKIPITIPTIGNRYMYFAVSSNVEFDDDGKIVKKQIKSFDFDDETKEWLEPTE